MPPCYGIITYTISITYIHIPALLPDSVSCTSPAEHAHTCPVYSQGSARLTPAYYPRSAPCKWPHADFLWGLSHSPPIEKGLCPPSPKTIFYCFTKNFMCLRCSTTNFCLPERGVWYIGRQEDCYLLGHPFDSKWRRSRWSQYSRDQFPAKAATLAACNCTYWLHFHQSWTTQIFLKYIYIDESLNIKVLKVVI